MLFAVNLAYKLRGYQAVGGEWLLLPLAIVIGQLAEEYRDERKEASRLS
jgi:hypothetical protein